jgi:hypothetical protein
VTESQEGVATNSEVQLPDGLPKEENISSLNRSPPGHDKDEPYPSGIGAAHTYEYVGSETYPDANDVLKIVVMLVPERREQV